MLRIFTLFHTTQQYPNIKKLTFMISQESKLPIINVESSD